MNGDITISQPSDVQTRSAHKLEPDRNNLLVIFGLITIISGTIATALLFSRVGYISLACAGGSLVVGGALMSYGLHSKNAEGQNGSKALSEKGDNEGQISKDISENREEALEFRKPCVTVLNLVYLPLGENAEHKESWEQLGITWINTTPIDKSNGIGKLPESWKFIEHQIVSYLVDEKECVRAQITYNENQTVIFFKKPKTLEAVKKLENQFQQLLTIFKEARKLPQNIENSLNTDAAWQNLKNFVAENPEYKQRLEQT